jgi:hypothetical protein
MPLKVSNSRFLAQELGVKRSRKVMRLETTLSLLKQERSL